MNPAVSTPRRLPLLPIDDVLPTLVDSLRAHPAVVLRAPAGAGKTTRVPPALLDAGLAPNGRIVMLEPRRIAARTAARRIAQERGVQVGGLVGYQVRFDERVSAATRIVAVTDGILLRRLQDDPFLEGIDAVLFDEFHERRLDSDLALGMVRRVQQTVRPELRIVVMSATLAAEPIAAYLGNCPVVESIGRLFPVEIEYARLPDRRKLPQQAAAAVERVLGRSKGDLLVFLPGVGEIRGTARELEPLAKKHELAVMPLYGDLPPEDQDRVLAPCPQRKVVLATNVAETSITIEGITAVVDLGLARVMRFDPHVGLDRLELTPISKASADQRAGRAGRTQPGTCLRLWDETTHRHRPDFEQPEIARVDLSGPVLQLLAWDETDVAAFPWFEPPPPAAIEHALELLRRLSAIDDDGVVTELGRVMVRLPVQPRLARLIVEGHRLGHPERVALVAALLSERDPFFRSDRGQPQGRGIAPTTAAHTSRSDVVDRLVAFEEYIHHGHTESHLGSINIGAAHSIRRVCEQLVRMLRQELGAAPVCHGRAGRAEDEPPAYYGRAGRAEGQSPPHGSQSRGTQSSSDEAVMRALLAAYPDRVARRRDMGSAKGLMVGGRGVRLDPRSTVLASPLFLCVDIDAGDTDALVRQASAIERDWLPAERQRTVDELFFHPTQKQVVARRRVYFDDLLLEESPASVPDSDDAAKMLFDAARAQWEQVFPGEAAAEFITRVRCLSAWMPDLGLPAFDREQLDDELRHLCRGRRSFAELRQAPWLAALQGKLTYQQLRAVETEAPERIEVPSGNRIRLTYDEGRPPVLAVRIQEIFGLRQTPRVAGGRVKVLLHLLAPNMRPQQVTDDLESFWAGAYSVVRKELRRRYPKHAWPEDPLTASPTRKPR